MPRPRVVLVSVALLSLCLAPLGRANKDTPRDDPQTAKARELFKSGTKHFNLAEYDPALTDFKEAFRLKEDPVFLYNIAQCHRLLNQHADAARFYRAYLRSATSQPNMTEEIEQRIQSEEALAVKEEADAKQRISAAEEQKRREAEIKAKELELQIAQKQAQRVYEPWYKDSTGWVLGGVGLGFSIVGVAMMGWGATLSEPNKAANPVLYDRYVINRNLGFGVGGAAAGLGLAALVTGVIKLAIYDKPPKADQLALQLVPLDGGGLIGLAGSY